VEELSVAEEDLPRPGLRVDVLLVISLIGLGGIVWAYTNIVLVEEWAASLLTNVASAWNLE
jgi:hypothetical protein